MQTEVEFTLLIVSNKKNFEFYCSQTSQRLFAELDFAMQRSIDQERHSEYSMKHQIDLLDEASQVDVDLAFYTSLI